MVVVVAVRVIVVVLSLPFSLLFLLLLLLEHYLHVMESFEIINMDLVFLKLTIFICVRNCF